MWVGSRIRQSLNGRDQFPKIRGTTDSSRLRTYMAMAASIRATASHTRQSLCSFRRPISSGRRDEGEFSVVVLCHESSSNRCCFFVKCQRVPSRYRTQLIRCAAGGAHCCLYHGLN